MPISYQSEIQPEFTPPVSAFCLFSERCAFSFACFHFFQTPWLSRASSTVTKPNRDKQQLVDHGSRPPKKQMHIILQGTNSLQWFCEFAIPILAATVAWYRHLVDDILDCSSSRDCVEIWGGTCRNLPRSVLEMWYVLLIHFASGVRNKKRYCCSSLLVLLRLEWFTWLGFLHAHVPEFRWIQCSYTGSVSRLVEENRPKTSVQWKKMK